MNSVCDFMNMCPSIHEHTSSFDTQSGKDEVLLRHEVEETLRDIVDYIEEEHDCLEHVQVDSFQEYRRNVARVLFSDDGYGIGEVSTISTDICRLCSRPEWVINERIETENGPGDILHEVSEEDGGGHICTSCSCAERDSRCCINCGLNEKLGRQFGITFSEDPDIFPKDLCCSVCEGFYPDISNSNWFEYEYENEYENEELPENNSEKATKIKGTVCEMGEILFDLQDKFTEGEYLKMMDLLQKVTNGVNDLS